MNSNHLLNKTKKAVIYCRVSTKEQVEEGNSLATQEKICKEYAFRNAYEIVHVFVEQGESAKTMLRTELKSMLDFCSNPKNEISAVIAYKIDRISRNTDDYSQIRLLLKRSKVEIKSTSEQFEDTPVGKFLENTMANIAQFDNDIRTERSVNGMKEAMREGRYVFNAAYGYINTRVAGKATITPHPEISQIVQRAFSEVAKNISPIEIVRKKLRSEGLAVCKAQFYNILRNEIYVGWITQFGERHKGLFEPIISQELFDRVQYVLKGRSRKNFRYLTKNPDFPLRRFIKLADGRKVTGSWSKGRKGLHAYYRFMANKIYFRKEELESLFLACLNCYTLDQIHYKKFIGFIRKQYKSRFKTKEQRIENAKQYVQTLREKKNALINKNLSGVISDETLKEHLSLIENEISEHEYSLLESQENFHSIDALLSITDQFYKEPAELWKKAPYSLRVQLQWFVFPEGIELDDTILRTKEICSLFKLKQAISPMLSNKVPLSVQTSDRGRKYSKQQKTYYLEIPQIKLSDQEIEELLPKAAKELELLQKTIEEI